MLWTQNSFAKGELSPYMYSRADMREYYIGLKTATNVITAATGAARKRFGTYYRGTATNISSADNISFEAFHYLNECVYQLVIRSGNIDIYLEGIRIATVSGTGMDAYDCANMDSTILDRFFRVTVEGKTFKPKDLIRSPSTPNLIASVASNIFTLTTPATSGVILPVKFTWAVAPTTSPQIKTDIVYFARFISTTEVQIYSSSKEALDQENPYTLSSAGTTANLVPQNTWAFSDVTYRNLPVYDFEGGYSTITFTPSATYGAAIVITLSGTLTAPATLDTKYKGGAFIGNGGVGRITDVTDTTHFTVAMIQPFLDTTPIPGRTSLLLEPAWSDTRGWPQKCSSFQSRALFANSQSLPNGFWASAINDYANFNDTQTDDDDAISSYPTSDTVNYINFIVPYRSLTVHTNSGVFSSPTAFDVAITPKSFSLYLQDSTPATDLQPRAIDNQIIVISGNDVHSMLWDGSNNAYQSVIISIMNEQLVRDPVDEAAYIDLTKAGSRYVFIVNADGGMAILQTLIAQDINGWTPAVTQQSFGDSAFRRVITDFTGRAWFLTERDVPTAGGTVNITSLVAADELGLASSVLNDGDYTLVRFATGSTMPATTPALSANEWYWARYADTNSVYIYRNQADAIADENRVSFTNFGSSATLTFWVKTATFMIEELTWETYLDCASYYSGTATDTVTGLSRFNGLDLKMIGDGFGFEATAINNEVVFESHGELVEVEEAYIGLPIETTIQTLPLAIAQSVNVSNLTRPTHIRNANFMFKDTIGGTIDGVDIALDTFDQVAPGSPPVAASGVFEMAIMQGWDDFSNPSFTLVHNEPFNFELLGIYYNVDV
jgi:hypothetical protein